MVERLEIPSLTSGRDNTFFDVRFYRGLWLESDEEKIYCPLTAKRSLCPRSEQQRARKERPHKSGQAAFKAIMSEDIDWKPFAAFPPPACLAVVVGEPSDEQIVGLAFISKKLLQAYESRYHFTKSWTTSHKR